VPAELPGRVDAVVVGAGVFGCALAIQLRKQGHSVLLVERENQPLERASFNNQARVHQGYHYPRSMLTAMRSRINFARFVDDYGDCVDQSRPAYYAVARSFSKVNAYQFQRFCQCIGAVARPAPKNIKALFHHKLIEAVYHVEEPVFDANRLRERLLGELSHSRVQLYTNFEVVKIRRDPDAMRVSIRHIDSPEREEAVSAKLVLNCTYSSLNEVLRHSDMETYMLKHELTEMALVSLPDPLSDLCITVMDGPFFSLMPFPPRGPLHTLSHVRYTPHYSWWERVASDRSLPRGTSWPQMVKERQSNFRYMRADAARYLPSLAQAEHHDSIWEIKTLLPRSETDDSRPILFAFNKQHESVISILGGKVDNLYDARDKLCQHLDAKSVRPTGGTL
jgi:glycine/D-amino acid oxidase-like deaminating enzyme